MQLQRQRSNGNKIQKMGWIQRCGGKEAYIRTGKEGQGQRQIPVSTKDQMAAERYGKRQEKYGTERYRYYTDRNVKSGAQMYTEAGAETVTRKIQRGGARDRKD